jgi:hypothetical protein
MTPRLLLVAVLTAAAAPSSVSAMDLADLRQSCQEESKRRFKGPRRMKPEVYRLVVERRQAFVRNCMSEGGPSVERTATVARAEKGFAPEGAR